MKSFSIKSSVIELTILVVLLFLLFYASADMIVSRSWDELWNLGHIPLFIFVVYLVYKYVPKIQTCSLIKQLLLIIVLSILLGVFIEFLQLYVDRQASMGDVFHDITGAVLAVPLFSNSFRCLPVKYKYFIYIFLCVLIIMLVRPLVGTLTDEYRSNKSFPVLADFEYPGELGRWSGDARIVVSKNNVVQGNYSLKVILNHKHYSGLELEYFPGNWTRYNLLAFNIFNPGKEFIPLVVSIFDKQHHKNRLAYRDRFNEQYLVKPGWNEVSIFLDDVSLSPASRVMDMAHILGLRLFVRRPRQDTTFYLDGVQLKN